MRPQLLALYGLPNPAARWSTTHWFWAFLVGHVCLWTLATWVMMPNATLDTVEMVYWGHEWQWGYYKHPPLPAWIAEGCFSVSGNSVLALFFTARVFIGVCFWGVWSLARRLVSQRSALLAVMALEASYYYTYDAYELNNNTATRPFLVLAVLSLYVALFEKRSWAWWTTGLCLGAGMLCKYDTAVLALLMLAYSVWEPRGRQAWRTAGPYCMLVISLAMFSPHVWWLIQNDFPTLSYLSRSSQGTGEVIRISGGWSRHLVFPLEFIAGQLGLLIPVVAICAAAFRPDRQLCELDEEARAKRRFLFFLGIGPAVAFVVVSALFGVKLSIDWGHNLWTWVPLLLFLVWKVDDSALRIRPLAGWCVAMGLVFIAMGMGRTFVFPHWAGRGLTRHFPGEELARQAEARWHEQFKQPLPVIAGNSWNASNIAMYSAERPSVFCEMNPRFSLWMNDEQLKTQGGVIVWEENRPEQAGLAEAVARFPGAYLADPIEAKWRTGAKLRPFRLQVAIIPPQQSQHETPSRISRADGKLRR